MTATPPDDDDPIPLVKEALRAALPHWPLSAWSTRDLCRQGRLGYVRIGRRYHVTRRLIAEFLARATVHPPLPTDEVGRAA